VAGDEKCKTGFGIGLPMSDCAHKTKGDYLARQLPLCHRSMERRALIYAVTAILAAVLPATANDVMDACHAFASADVIFVGRVKGAPITRRISGEQEIEKARAMKDAAERDLKQFEALKMPPEIGQSRHLELTIRMIKAADGFDRARAMHPPPVDVSVTPLLVETPFRGVTTPELFMWNRGQPELDPARSYLFYAERPMGPLAPDVIFAAQPKELEAAEADLRFLHEVAANDQNTLVHGSLTFQDPDNQMRRTSLAGVVLRVTLDGQHYETSTGADGTFMLTGVPPGMLRIEPALPENLTLPPQSNGGIVKGGCLAVHMRATLNGRIRGRVALDSGEPFRGIVDIVPHGHSRQLPQSHAFSNEAGEFAFSALPPGDYLLGINVLREPRNGAPFAPTYFPGTTDRSLATPVTVGAGTEHAGIDWIVSSRLREGSMEVTFDTAGESQKDALVCVTRYDSNLRATDGAGYEPRSGAVVVPVVEGVRYRFMAYARTASGFARSDTFDFIGAPGRQSIRLRVASTTQIATGQSCAGDPRPFSPSR